MPKTTPYLPIRHSLFCRCGASAGLSKLLRETFLSPVVSCSPLRGATTSFFIQPNISTWPSSVTLSTRSCARSWRDRHMHRYVIHPTATVQMGDGHVVLAISDRETRVYTAPAELLRVLSLFCEARSLDDALTEFDGPARG